MAWWRNTPTTAHFTAKPRSWRGITIDRATLAFWVGYAAAEIKPVWRLLRDEVLKANQHKAAGPRARARAQAKVMGLLMNPNYPRAEDLIRSVQQAAHTKGVQLDILNAGTESEIDAAFATLVQLHVDALLVFLDPFFFSRREQLLSLASRHAVPAVYPWRDFAADGGLASYAPSFPAAYRETGIYAGKILKGAKPADLPVQQPTTYELVVNLKTAKALGLSVPASILARADEIIE
jgi:putative tryptophan/tyrosine transport system substrate-binding protein